MEAEGANSARHPDLAFGLRNFRFELTRAWHVVEQARRQYGDANAEANRRINLALIGADYGSITELSWLRWARVRYGALGEWRIATASSPRVLRIASVFAGGPDPISLTGREFSPAVSGPRALLSARRAWDFERREHRRHPRARAQSRTACRGGSN